MHPHVEEGGARCTPMQKRVGLGAPHVEEGGARCTPMWKRVGLGAPPCGRGWG